MSLRRPTRITVIDDHSEFLDLMRDFLSAEHDVTVLRGGDVSVQEIVDSRPDLLIVDLRLERADLQGSDLLMLVRAHSALELVPVIICSADAEELKGRAGPVLDAGNTALLMKPFSLDEAESLVAEALTLGFPVTAVSLTDPGVYGMLLESDREIVLIADADGRYVDASAGALGLLGLTRDELVGRSVADIVALDRAWTDAEWQRYQRNGWWQGAVTLRLADERALRMQATARIAGTAERPIYVSWLQPIDQEAVAS
jgi:PAS domain S-box-containing protein